jgi:hypothetical protein
VAAIAAGLAIATISVAAAVSYTLAGGASISASGHPGNAALLTSDSTSVYGRVDIAGFPTNPTAITALSFDYNPDATGNSGGSPRLVVSFSDGGTAELRPLTLTAGAWVTLDGMTGTNWDNNGGSCGFVYGTTWSAVVACHAGATINGMWVVNDSGWMFPTTGLNVLVDNITINSDVITFDAAASADSCKKGGWETMTDSNGNTFKNQGDCVSFFATGGKNPGDVS